MTGFLLVLVLVGLVAAGLEVANRRRRLYAGRPGDPNDRDRQRMLDELRAAGSAR